MSESSYLDLWPHAPPHWFVPEQSYMITSSTLRKKQYFHSGTAKTLLVRTILEQCQKFDWQLQAWAVMANHFHLIARSPQEAKTLKPMMRAIHSISAKKLNEQEGEKGRRIWFQYWDTCLTYEKSYFARLHYVMVNPVKHRLVDNAEDYPWGSIRWFQSTARPAFQRTVFSFQCDRVAVRDDF